MKKLIYIIDDDPVYLKFMEEHFTLMNEYETKVFESGPQAIQKLNTENPYLIILDHIFLNDPHNTGLEYLKEIRIKNKTIPVIYITVMNEESIRKKAAQLKVNDFIIKNEAFLVFLRKALDEIATPPKKSILNRLFNR